MRSSRCSTRRSARSTSSSGHGEKDPSNSERGGYSSISDALKRDNYQFDKLILAQQELPADATVIVIAGPRTDLLPRRSRHAAAYLAKRGHLLVMVDPPKTMPLRRRCWKGSSRNGRSTRATTWSSTPAAWASCSAPMRRCPSPRRIRTHAITNGFSVLTAYPLARVDRADERAARRPHSADDHRDKPAQLGGGRPQGTPSGKVEMNRTSRRQARSGLDRRRRVGPVAAPPAADASEESKPAEGRGRAEAGDPDGRGRRFGLRDQRGARHPGQPRPLHEHRELAGAAGEPDRHPAARRGRPADHADRD